ncbi:hypothetical protein [uncultured Novosphingobium sp.]|uniref:hypothetical protein n=1 Tax=uncultured Novosphingobium sp. TaxID=292277 RepID=UPI00258C8BEB|nr:hypothetical protein [uncultured Novosphingobium sp.]
MNNADKTIDPHRFVADFEARLETILSDDLTSQKSKRTTPATEFVLQSLLRAVNDAVRAQTWPSNEPLDICVSAHKETELMREFIEADPTLADVAVTSCKGSNLDFQARLGDTVLVNAECELHGAKDRAGDRKKLDIHEEQPLVSVMAWRGKTLKDVHRTSRNMLPPDRQRSEPILSVGLYWPNNKPLSTARVIIERQEGGASMEGLDSSD